MISQSCRIVSEQKIAEGQRWYQRIGRWRLPIGCR